MPLYTLIALLVLCTIAVGMWLRKMLPAQRERWFGRMLRMAAWLRTNVQELVGIPFALFLYWISGIVLRYLDPTSALYDSGVLQGISVAIVHLVIGNSLARFGVALNAARIDKGQQAPINTQWLFATYLLAYCLLAAFI